MNRTLALTNRVTLAVTAASVALGAFAALASTPARAYEIQPHMSAYNQADVAATTELDSDAGAQRAEFKITKVLDAATPELSEISGLKMEYDVIAVADINIGVGELQECTISKSMDSASSKLAQYAINGNSPAPGDGSLAAPETTDSRDGAGGNVEFEWKVEEGES